MALLTTAIRKNVLTDGTSVQNAVLAAQLELQNKGLTMI